jgi:hypothetical protein
MPRGLDCAPLADGCLGFAGGGPPGGFAAAFLDGVMVIVKRLTMSIAVELWCVRMVNAPVSGMSEGCFSPLSEIPPTRPISG